MPLSVTPTNTRQHIIMDRDRFSGIRELIDRKRSSKEKGRAYMGDYQQNVRFGANVDPTAHDPS